MKKILIIGSIFLVSVTLYAGNNGVKIQTLILRINTIIAEKGIETQLEPLEVERLSSFVQSLQRYENDLNLEGIKTLFRGKAVLHNNWLAGRDLVKLRDENNQRIKTLLSYMKNEKKDYKNEANTDEDKSKLIEDVKSYLISGKDETKINATDLFMMQKIFEYEVNNLENIAPELRTIASGFETKVKDVNYIQWILFTYLKFSDKKSPDDVDINLLDITSLLDYSKRLLYMADLVGPGLDGNVTEGTVKLYRETRSNENGYLRRISQNLKLIEAFASR